RLAMGDTLVLLSSLAFSMHILLIDHFAPHTDPLTLSCVQFLACGAISGAFMLFFEQPTLSGLCNATLPLLYTGLLSSGVAYTLQVFAQKSVPPVVASLVLSLESVFALIGSFLLLGQTITAREGLGCALIFVATLLAQLPVPTKKVRKNRKCDILDL
ncbi:MAG: DMT family transporter, partial [Clostridia bacterium]|nr:DMT family transporter [Clostridia bacterium]